MNNPLTQHRTIHSTSLARWGSEADEEPLSRLKTSPYDALEALTGRSHCHLCNKSRKFFCYNCCVPVPELCGRLPRLALPVAVDIVKHPAETDGKSTATHACVVAPDHAFIHTYPHFPDYGDQPGVMLVYPAEDALPLRELVARHEIRKLVFIDSTWQQANGILADSRLKGLPRATLTSRRSLFWRYQRDKPDDHLATIEAIYYAVLELAEAVDGQPVTDGRYDDLLYFFKYFCRQVSRIHFRK